ncbi:hypothetical protein [Nitratiruptor sp. SB155-2]|uniref:hypothetical protein n=1 Tax=Nitratiruptor sp. (strain SB155-2) TaxID=387092 RepID=UPI0002EBB97B|nr:hypothetical protein [Nitratiruptor sp. SB155-2]
MSTQNISSIVIFIAAFLIDVIIVGLASVLIFEIATFLGAPNWLAMSFVVIFGVVSGKYPQYLPHSLIQKALKSRPDKMERE